MATSLLPLLSLCSSLYTKFKKKKNICKLQKTSPIMMKIWNAHLSSLKVYKFSEKSKHKSLTEHIYTYSTDRQTDMIAVVSQAFWKAVIWISIIWS